MGLLDSLFGKKKQPDPTADLRERAERAQRARRAATLEQAPPRPRAEAVDDCDESKLPDNAVLLGGQDRVEVRGEQRHQDVFDRICGGKCPEGHLRRVYAILQPAPDNPVDPNAIEVRVAGEMVGFMARESAEAYAPIAKLLADKGKVGAARAFIRGGWQRGGGDEGFYGIELELSTTEKLLKTRKITALR